MDQTDRKILVALAADARISLKQLASVAGLSPPTVAERVRRLEDRGCITGYSAVISPPTLGYSIQAIVRIDPLPGALKDVERMIQDTEQFVECDRVTGEDCYYARLLCRSIEELDEILDPFHERARTNTAIVKGQPVKRRLPPLT